MLADRLPARLQLQLHKYIWTPTREASESVSVVTGKSICNRLPMTDTDASGRALSGGLDSYTAAAIAKAEGFALCALTIRYGQRHAREIEAARARRARARRRAPSRARRSTSRHRRLGAHLGRAASRATATSTRDGHSVTYVPARNTIFLSLALGWAEVLGARDIVIGVNALDYSGYPDCRPEFIARVRALAALATRAGVEGGRFRVHTPLIALTKADIIRRGSRRSGSTTG